MLALSPWPSCAVISNQRSSVKAPVAQWIEHLTSDQKVRGSSPFGRANVPKRLEKNGKRASSTRKECSLLKALKRLQNNALYLSLRVRRNPFTYAVCA
jgi:hypothetical protein